MCMCLRHMPRAKGLGWSGHAGAAAVRQAATAHRWLHNVTHLPAQLTWLVIHCGDRPGLLAEVANVIARHDHNITVRAAAVSGAGPAVWNTDHTCGWRALRPMLHCC